MNTKRTWFVLLTWMLLAAQSAQAQFAFTTNNGTITITGYTGSARVVSIPGTINNLPVTVIGDEAFYLETITSVTIPDSVTRIGNGAFAWDFLTNITIPESVTSIGSNAFLSDNELTNVMIPSSVTNIGDGAFASCFSLTAITVEGQNSFYSSVNGALFDKNQTALVQFPAGRGGGYTFSYTIPETVTSIGDFAFDNCYALTSITIPAGLTSIGEQAFYACESLTSLTIPNTVTNIGDGAFAGCSGLLFITVNSGNMFYSSGYGVLFDQGQKTLICFPGGLTGLYYPGGLNGVGLYTIPGSVTNIDDYAFYETHLTSLTIPSGVTSLGNNAFAHSSVTSITIPDSVISIGTNAFGISALASITIPDSVTSIGAGTFQICYDLTSITIPDSVTDIGEQAFANDSYLTGVTIGNSVTNIGDEAFVNDALTSLTIPDSVTSIGNSAFVGSSLTSLTIPDSVTSIGDYAFNGNPLKTITIPESVTNIGVGAFVGNLLEATTVDSQNPFYSSKNGVLFNKAQTTLVQYPPDSLRSYAIPNSVTSIGDAAFDSCYVTNVTIPDSVTSIGSNAFAFGVLTRIVIPDSVTNIGGGAFEQCYSLTKVTIGSSVTNIGDSAFENCAGLTSVYFEGTPPAVGSNVFTSDTNATAYYLPGATGWGPTFAGIPTALWNPQTGSLQVTIKPAGAITTGARWQVDDGTTNNSGAIVANLTVGSHNISFTPIPGWTTPRNQVVTIKSGTTTEATGVYAPAAKGNPTLTITSPRPAQGVTGSNAVFTVTGTTSDKESVTNVWYQFNGGSWASATPAQSWSNWTAGVALSNGANTISAYAQDISGSFSTTNIVNFKFFPSDILVVVVSPNENGKVTPDDDGQLLGLGTNFTLTASPGRNWIFSNWVASGSEDFVSANPVLKFTMQSNLVLQANFVTNVFLAAQGIYHGLFAPASPPREQTNSGSFTLNVTSAGAVSGDLCLGPATIPLSGKFDVSGYVEIPPSAHRENLTTTLQLNLADQSVQGMVTDGSFVAMLNGDQVVFSTTHPATDYEGSYTLIIPGTNDPAAGPFGISYGTVTVSAAGAINFVGHLADGTTSVSQSSAVSKDGNWPFYVPLYGGAGSLWGTNYFTNHTIVSVPFLSWINATNSAKTAVYRSGFTNQQATVLASLYNSTSKPLLSLTHFEATLAGGDLPFSITNQIEWASNNVITVPVAGENTNGLKLKLMPAGMITGTFLNPTNPKLTITVNGVLLPDQTNAQGYFLGTNQSGAFLLENP